MSRPPSGRRATAVALALVLAVVVALLAAPGDARVLGDDDEPQVGTISLVELTTFVAPDDELRVAIDISDAPPGATLDVALHERVSSGRLTFLRTAAGDDLGVALRSYRDLPLADLPAGDDADVELSFAIVDDGDVPLAGFRLERAGVHPFALTLRDAEGEELAELVTHVVRLPAPDTAEAEAPLAVALVVPLEAEMALRPDGSQRLAPADAAGLDVALEALTAHPEVALNIAPTPETLEALAARDEDLGRPASTGAEAGDAAPGVADLAAALPGRQVMARPYVPLATSSWVAAADDVELVTQLDAGIEVTDRLLDAPARRGAWLLDPTIDPPTLTALRRLGIDRVVVPEAQLDPLPSSFDRTLTRSFTVRDGDDATIPAVASDSTLGLELLSSDEPALAANRVLADLSILALDENGSGRGVALATPTGAETPTALDDLLAGLGTASDPPAGAAPLLVPVTLDGLFAEVASAGDPDSGGVLERTYRWEEPVALGPLPAAIDRREAQLRSYRSMLPAGTDPTAALVRRLLLAAAHRDISGDLRQDLLDEVDEHLSRRTAGITAPPQGTVTLTASEGSIPVVLENELDEVMRVRLALTAEKLEFPDGSVQEVDLQPGTNRVEVRVRARASGAFPVDVAVTSPDGVIDVGETRVQVRSTAVSGLGLVLAVAAGAFLALWWARNLRSGRRRERLVASDHPATRSESAPAKDQARAGEPADSPRPG